MVSLKLDSRSMLVGAIIGALVVACGAAMFWPKRKAGVPAVATVTDTVRVNDSTVVIHYQPDPAASKQLAKLREELAGKQSAIDGLVSYLAEMQQENQYLADSLSRLVLDSVRGIVRVSRTPAGLAVTTYEHGLVQNYRLAVWRDRFSITSSKGAPKVETSRLPVDLGAFAAGGFSTRPDTWTAAPYVWAGLTMRRAWLTAVVGPAFDGRLTLRGEVRAEWR